MRRYSILVALWIGSILVFIRAIMLPPPEPSLLVNDPVCDYRAFISKCLASENVYRPVDCERKDACYPAIAYRLLRGFPSTADGERALVCFSAAVLIGGLLLLLCSRFGIRGGYVFVSVALTEVLLAGPLRGNPSSWAAAAIFVFIVWHDAPNRSRRLIAALALSFAVSLKLTPAIWGILYLRERALEPREWPWVEIISVGIVSLMLLLIPFAGFGGTQAITDWWSNALANAAHYGSLSRFGFVEIANRYFIENAIATQAAIVMSTLVAIAATVAAAFTRTRGRVLLLLGGAMVLLSHHEYGLVYLLPAFAEFVFCGSLRRAPVLALLESVLWFVIMCPIFLHVELLTRWAFASIQNEAFLLLLFLELFHSSVDTPRMNIESLSRA